MNPSYLPLIGQVALSVVMLLAWLHQRRTRNAGLVDVLWTAGIGLLSLSYAFLGTGWGPRRALAGALIGAWALRLGLHLAKRVASEPEDGRYADLRRAKGDTIDTWLFGFFQAQAVLAVLLSLVFFVLCQAETEGWRLWDGLGAGLWILALWGEHASDEQLRQWRENPANRGRSCRAGLWRYSRHPNYFFEWLTWVAYALIGVGLEHGAWTWLAPLVMFLLVRYVTGVPPTEEQSLRSRGEDYRAYQRSTNAFFPGPPQLDKDQVPETA